MSDKVKREASPKWTVASCCVPRREARLPWVFLVVQWLNGKAKGSVDFAYRSG